MKTTLLAQLETRVELVDGYLRISQPDDADPDGRDDVILIAPENVEAFIARVRDLFPAPETSNGRSAQRRDTKRQQHKS